MAQAPAKATQPIEINFNDREDVRASIAGCASLIQTGGKFNTKQIATCNKSVDSVLRNGWLTDFPDVLLSLQGNPPKSKTDISAAREIVAQISEDLRAKVPMRDAKGRPVMDQTGNPVTVPKLRGVQSVTYCPPGSGKSCDQTPITRAEVLAVLDGEKSSGLTKKRALRLDTSTAVMIGIHDGYMNANSLLRLKPDGTEMTLQQTAAAIRSETPDDVINRTVDLCRMTVGDVNSCVKMGSRKGLVAAADNARRSATR